MYNAKLVRIAKMIKEETSIADKNPRYITRELQVRMKITLNEVPPNEDERKKLFFLAASIDIFGCKSCPDVDTMNNTLGSLTEEIYT